MAHFLQLPKKTQVVVWDKQMTDFVKNNFPDSTYR